VKNEIRKKYGLLPPERIVEIRNKLGLSQAELEELLGTGSKVVVRWESGKVIQGSGQDNILRLLDRDPTFLESLRQIQRLRSDEQKKYQQTNKSNTKEMVAQAV
jgi:putative zinc finger/helix-turn-helix YgiT family protein